MARKIFALGIFVMAAGCGVIGYQVLTYYFYGRWPTASFHFVYVAVFGDFPVLEWHWENDLLALVGKLPVSFVALSVSYALLLLSDFLRGPNRRPSS
jgi:hypothetical protein